MAAPHADTLGPPLPIPRRPLIATLDACVLYPNYLRDFLLSTAYDGHLYAPRWSESIPAELSRNLIEDAGLAPDRANRFFLEVYRGFEQVLPTVLQRQLGHYRTHPLSVPELAAILKDTVSRPLALLDQM